MSETFYRFMTAQTERNDVVGDLARDICRDRSFPKIATSHQQIWSHLLHASACHGAMSAFSEAWAEYRRAVEVTRP